MSAGIHAVVMPKWGLAMQEGILTKWLVDVGAEIKPGLEICDIETSKIANAMEATVSGRLHRRLAEEGTTLPVGALMAVVTEGQVAETDVEAFIAKFEADFAAAAASGPTEAPANKVVEVGAAAVNYLQMGDGGVPIVFIHGFGGDLNNWMFNQPALAEKRATIALDLPGHGASSKEIADGSLGALAATVTAVLDKLGVEHAHLVGHSMGGAIALQVALEQPSRVDSVTAIASAGLGPDINMDYIDGFIGASGRKDIKPVLELLFADPGLVSRDMINDILKYKRLDGVDAALRAIAQANFAGGKQSLSLRDKLAGLKVPLQVIVGAKDRIIPPAHAKGLPGNVKIHVIETAGHMPHMEAAGDVNRLLAAIAG
jgi:pyruvate dehydrogenase E2 component (dihydrolipoamide acetyltransferase)